MTATFPANYFRDRPHCTFGVWAGLSGLTVRNIRRNGKDSGVNTLERKGLKVGLTTSQSQKNYELLSPKLWLPSNEWIRISIRFSPYEVINIPELLSDSFRVWISDFGGDPTIEEVPLPADFLIRRVSLRTTTDLYNVPANELKNYFISGFGVDYSTSPEAVEINLSELTIKTIGGG